MPINRENVQRTGKSDCPGHKETESPAKHTNLRKIRGRDKEIRDRAPIIGETTGGGGRSGGGNGEWGINGDSQNVLTEGTCDRNDGKNHGKKARSRENR